MAIKDPKPCVICGSVFNPLSRRNVTCSPSCRRKLHNIRDANTKAKLTHECIWCGKPCRRPCKPKYKPVCGSFCRSAFGQYKLGNVSNQWTAPVPKPAKLEPKRFCIECGIEISKYKRLCSEHKREHKLNYRKTEAAKLSKRIANRNRKARKRNAFVEQIDPIEIYKRDGWRCHLCKKLVRKSAKAPHPLSPTIDHIIPIAKGGMHEKRNVACAHFSCNSAKGDRGSGEQLLLIG